MKLSNTLFAVTLAIASFGIATSAKADTVTARCDVYPKGEDRATSSGLCTFSQRQGIVGIQLKNGKRYDLVPVDNRPGNYRDRNGSTAYQESNDKGQIFRLVNESIFVYWDTAPYGQNPGDANSSKTALKPEYWVVKATRTFLKASPGIFSETVTNNVPKDTVLRNFGCQRRQLPTWCQVELRDNPQIKGWAWSPDIKEYQAGASTLTPSQTAASTPVTVMTRRNNNQIAAQITEGEFKFSGILTRTSGNIFQGSDGRARVIYDRGAGRVTIVNPQTGDEFYNYNYTDVDEGRL